MKNKDFCIFILTHGRPNNVLTYKTLMKSGCTYPIYFIVDNEDKTIEEYHKNFGKERVIVFDKLAISKTFDTGDNFDNRKCIVFARNACFDIAKELGYTYFLQLDDDYFEFNYKFDADYNYKQRIIKSINEVLDLMLDFYKSTEAKSIAFLQCGDFIGGGNGTDGKVIKIKRKAMNTFFCSTQRPFKFVGRINEDVNVYTSLQARGNLFFSIPNVAINQTTTQEAKGGMSETYLESGTYIKSFYTVMYAPSCTEIRMMGQVHPRLHHQIRWNHAVPKLVSEDIRKQ